jgi:hypothetical protein
MDSIKESFYKYDDIIDKYDLYIWDFDLTILKIHSYANEIKKEDVESLSWKKLMCHFADPIFFRDLVYYLIGCKKKVAIISFGDYNVIKAYLDRLFDNDNIFDNHNILTPFRCNRHQKINSDKNQYIIDLVRENNIEYPKVLFFDDTYTNITNASELGVKAIKINEKNGFTQTVWNEFINNNKQILIEKEKEKEGKKDIIFDNKPKYIPENKINGNIIENFENKDGNDKNKAKDNESKSLFNIKIDDRYINWINIFAIIFLVSYFYFYMK